MTDYRAECEDCGIRGLAHNRQAFAREDANRHSEWYGHNTTVIEVPAKNE